MDPPSLRCAPTVWDGEDEDRGGERRRRHASAHFRKTTSKASPTQFCPPIRSTAEPATSTRRLKDSFSAREMATPVLSREMKECRRQAKQARSTHACAPAPGSRRHAWVSQGRHPMERSAKDSTKEREVMMLSNQQELLL